MILQALHELYGRLASEEGNPYLLPSYGYSLQRIAYAIVIEPTSGKFIRIAPLRTKEKTKSGKTMTCDRPILVPGGDKPTGVVNQNTVHKKTLFLRNDSAFLLGARPKKSRGSLDFEPAIMEFEAFRKKHLDLEDTISSKDFSSVCRFLEHWNPKRAAELSEPYDITTKEGKPAVGVFSIRGQSHYVHECPQIKGWWIEQAQTEAQAEAMMGKCIINFQRIQKEEPIARLHTPKIKGVEGGQSSGALLVSYDEDSVAYCSYGGDQLQGLNAPVSLEASFRYCAALSTLTFSPTRWAKRHRLKIGDATTVFWTESPTKFEQCITGFMAGFDDLEDQEEPIDSQATTLLKTLQDSLRAVSKGGNPSIDFSNELATPFYVLGLTGQAGGRIGIRFWHQTTVGDLMQNLAAHQADLAIIRVRNDSAEPPAPEFPAVWMILRQTAREPKDIPPNLGGALMRSILQRSAYPEALPQKIISRIRVSEKDSKGKPTQRVSYLRAAALKAFLNRNHKMKMSEALDPEREDPAYHLGRLFAVYETAQKHAHDWKLERTIRETMYSAASATPLSVFGRLERLHHHHTAKKSHPPGSSDSYAEIVGEISQKFRGPRLYPTTLNIVEQSLFAVGYYHQLQWFKFRSLEKKNQLTNASA